MTTVPPTLFTDTPGNSGHAGASAAQTTPWIGRVIDGRYVVEAMIGEGGMGVVLAARHQFTGAHLAVKMIRPDVVVGPELEARFLAEARAPNAIGHRGIVEVLDAGKAPTGELYLVMELLAGRSLRDGLAAGPLRPGLAARIATELLDVLAVAHARSFVHRDLKPENVFLVATDPARMVKLLDFGIAKSATALNATPLTVAGAVMGTVQYMSPEQMRDASTVDARADLWAVAIMLYEMLCAAVPYQGTSLPELFTAITTRPPIALGSRMPNVPPALDAWFARALARDPNARFASATEMSAALAAVLPSEAPAPAASSTAALPAASTSTAAAAAGATTATLAHPPARRPVVPIAIGAGGVVLLLIAIGLVAGGGGGAKSKHVAAIDASSSSSHDDATTVTIAADSGTAFDAAATTPPERGGISVGDILSDAAVAVPNPRNAPVKTAPPPRATSDCATMCNAMQSCGLIDAAACNTNCRAQPAGQLSCFFDAGASCNALANCGWQAVCGAPLGGTGSCRAAMVCQDSSCKVGDVACGCRCAAVMSASHSSILLRLDGCATACAGDPTCIQTRCSSFLQACANE